MSNILLHIADRVLNRPLLVTPDKAQIVLEVLSGRIGVNAPEANRFDGQQEPQKDADGSTRTDRWGYPLMAPYRVASGVALIPIVGSLVNRGAWIGASSGLVSYEGIQHQLKSAAADSQVRSILLDISSPGGEAIGAFETAAMVRQIGASKPVVAVVNGMAASAAYAIASGAGRIVTTETGVSGSIGVVLLHADFSRSLANDGISPTLIFAGAHKVDGNPFEPLSDAVKGDLQAEVNAFYDQFLATVAAGRGSRMSAEMARATEARTLIGAKAVAAGLADDVGSFESVLAELQQSSTRAPASGRTTLKGKSMDNPTGAPAAEAGISQANHQAAVNAAEKKGFDAATSRLSTVLSADGVKGDAGRMVAALDLAVKAPTMAAADVTAFVTANVAATLATGAPATVTAVLAKMDKAAEGVTSRPSTEGTAGETPKPAATTPEGWKAEWEASAALQAEFFSAEAYVAHKRYELRSAA